jgi:hypothetical protein
MEEAVSGRLISLLADHNIEGQADILWGVVGSRGWLALTQARLVKFVDVGLANSATDREVWRFAQANNMVLLTANRKMEGNDSLEQTIREENHSEALPVITIARPKRLIAPSYRERCATRVIEVLSSVDAYKGVGRIFIP